MTTLGGERPNHRGGHLRSAGVLTLAALATSALGGYLAASSPGTFRYALVGIAAAALIVCASLYPARVFQLGILCLVLTPPFVYTPPTAPPHPAVVVFAAVTFGLIVRSLFDARGRSTGSAYPRLNLIDGIVILLLAAFLANVAAGVRTRHELEPLAIGWGTMYLSTRVLLAGRFMTVRRYFQTWIAAALIVSPAAYYEALTGTDPFRRLAFDPGPNIVWLQLQQTNTTRFGIHRVAGSMGHPIAFAMFFAVAALMALALGLTATHRAGFLRWAGCSLFFAATQALALSRTGWLLLGVGVLFFLASTAAYSVRRRVLPIVIAAAAAIAAGVLLVPDARKLAGLGDPYRATLIQSALHRHLFHLLGNSTTAFQGLVGSPLTLAPSIDNQYLLTADQWGYLGFAALLAVTGTTMCAYARLTPPGEPQLLAGITAASLLSLVAVAFITQQQCIIWSLIGATAAVSTGKGSPPDQNMPPDAPVIHSIPGVRPLPTRARP